MGDSDSLFGDELLSGLSGRMVAGAASKLCAFISFSPAASDPDRDLLLNRVSVGNPPPPSLVPSPYMEYDSGPYN